MTTDSVGTSGVNNRDICRGGDTGTLPYLCKLSVNRRIFVFIEEKAQRRLYARGKPPDLPSPSLNLFVTEIWRGRRLKRKAVEGQGLSFKNRFYMGWDVCGSLCLTETNIRCQNKIFPVPPESTHLLSL